MPLQARGVLHFRQIVLVLAIGYFIYQFIDTDRTMFGWQFRFLTIWGLSGIVLTSVLMLRLSMGQSTNEHLALISAACVISGMVVLLYWRLYFDDPSSVSSRGEPSPWFQPYYLHLLGPLLQWIDALFILGAFRVFVRPFAYLIGLIIVYALWIELFVQRFNDAPAGRVTSGLPYPFLNNLTLDDRLMFYVTNGVVALLMLAIGFAANWVIGRTFRR